MNTKDIIMRSFDVSNVENDFIYQLVDHYLTDISINPSNDLYASINNLVDTILSYYMSAKQNGVIDLENSRRMLALKLGKDPGDKINEESTKLIDDMSRLEEYLKHRNSTEADKAVINIEMKEEIGSDIDYLLDSHTDFLTDLAKQNVDLNTDIHKMKDITVPVEEKVRFPLDEETRVSHDNNLNETIIQQMTIIENKLREDMATMSKNLLTKISEAVTNPIKNNISYGDIDEMGKKSKHLEHAPNKTNIDREDRIESVNTTDCIYPEDYQLDEENTTELLSDISTDAYLKENHGDNIEVVPITVNTTKTERSDALEDAFKRLTDRLNSPLINLLIAVIIIKLMYSFFGF